MTLLVLLPAAAGAQIIAPRRRLLAHGLDFWPQRLPQFAQVIHGPDRFAQGVEPGNAGAARAVFVKRYPRACSAL